MLKNTIYIVVLTVVLTAVFTLGFVGICPTTPMWLVAAIAISGLWGILGGRTLGKVILMSGSNFGYGKSILIYLCWVLHCYLYAIIISFAVEVVRIFFA